MKIDKAIGKLASYSSQGDDFLLGLQTAQLSIPPRRFKGEELRGLLGGPSTTHIYNKLAELKGPRVTPPAATKNTGERKLGCTIDEVMALQKYFKTSPCRAVSDEPVSIAFTNFKGGCWKTTTCWYAASYFASLGYRVLCVDLDPQASLTENLGLLPDIVIKENDSLSNFIVGLEGFDPDRVGDIIKDTYLPNLKIIPGCLGLASTEYDLITDMVKAMEREDHEESLRAFLRVRNLLERVKWNFDIVLMDGSPSLGMLPLNIVFAADVVVVPVPTEPTDFSSTKTFCKLLRTELETIQGAFPDLDCPEFAFLPTRYGASSTATLSSDYILQLIRETFGEEALQSYIRKHESVVSNLSMHRRTIFDVNPGTVTSELGSINIPAKGRERAMTNFSEAFDEILEKLIIPKWPSKSDNGGAV